jgi:hypothetical protein
MYWAMRIDEPDKCPVFQEMSASLPEGSSIRLVDFDEYVGLGKDICIKEVKGKNDPELGRAIDVYQKIFKDRDTTTACADFREAFDTEGLAHQPEHCYHLWTISSGVDADYQGMASFLTNESGGVCGYLGFIVPIPDPDQLRLLVARMEERIMRDLVARTEAQIMRDPVARIEARIVPRLVARMEERMVRDAVGAGGWTIAWYDETQRYIYSKLGFQAADASHHQSFEQTWVPGKISGSPAQPVHLLYKPFGRKY